jgi:hypothetical protein
LKLRSQGASLIQVVDPLEGGDMRDEGPALRYEEFSGWDTLLEGRSVLQVMLAFTLHERNFLLELPSSLLSVSYHLAHFGLCGDTLALGLEDVFLFLEVMVFDAQGPQL